MSSHNVRAAQTLLRLFPRGALHPRAPRRPRLGRLGDRQDLGPAPGRRGDRLVGRPAAGDRGRRPRQRGRRRLLDPGRPLPGRPARGSRRLPSASGPTRACSASSASRTRLRMREFFDAEMTAEKAHLGRWRQQLGGPRPRPASSAATSGRSPRSSARATTPRRRSAPRSTARRRGPGDEPADGPPRRRAADPLRDQQRDRSRPPEPGDGDRPPPAAPGYALVVLHALRRRARSSRPRAGTSTTSRPTGGPASGTDRAWNLRLGRCSSRSSPSASPISSSSTASIPTGR